jgi:Arc/MetJ-type ribon-helix-helix transcriptional regulator
MDPDDAESSYPLSEWMIPANDQHGHSAKVICRLPPSYKHQIAAILQQGRYPWETESDLVRVAVHRLLMAVDREINNPDITSQQAMLNSVAEVARAQMEYSHFQAVLEKLSLTVQDLTSKGAHPMAKKVIQAVSDQIDRFEEPYWKKRYTDELLTRFEHLGPSVLPEAKPLPEQKEPKKKSKPKTARRKK